MSRGSTLIYWPHRYTCSFPFGHARARNKLTCKLTCITLATFKSILADSWLRCFSNVRIFTNFTHTTGMLGPVPNTNIWFKIAVFLLLTYIYWQQYEDMILAKFFENQWLILLERHWFNLYDFVLQSESYCGGLQQYSNSKLLQVHIANTLARPCKCTYRQSASIHPNKILK